MSEYLDVLSGLILISGFLLMANKRIKSYIQSFRIQSALIALATGLMGISSLIEKGSFDLIFVCIIIVGAKVILIPHIMSKTYASTEYRVEKDFFLNIPILIIGCCVLVAISYFLFSGSGSDGWVAGVRTINSVSLTLIGMLFMISRKKAIGQIIGFLAMENGIFITALFATHGMPFIADMGVVIDLLSAVMIMGVMVLKIDRKFDSIDINKMKNLRG